MNRGATFDEESRALLLGVKGVGATVILRFEEIGIATLADLADQDAADVCERVSAMIGSPCWRTAPRARANVAAAITAARGAVAPPA